MCCLARLRPLRCFGCIPRPLAAQKIARWLWVGMRSPLQATTRASHKKRAQDEGTNSANGNNNNNNSNCNNSCSSSGRSSQRKYSCSVSNLAGAATGAREAARCGRWLCTSTTPAVL